MTDHKAAIVSVPGGVRVSVHAQPGAKRTQVAGLHGDAIKVRVQAPPVDGRANDELVRYLAECLSVPRASVSLVRGDKSRSKVFEIRNVDEATARRILLAASDASN